MTGEAVAGYMNIETFDPFTRDGFSGDVDADMAYLDRFGIKTIVHLRSNEEIGLYPNHWAAESRIEVVRDDYSFAAMMSGDESGDRPDTAELYPRLLDSIEPQIKTYFQRALDEGAPRVVNCLAGQDRTAFHTSRSSSNASGTNTDRSRLMPKLNWGSTGRIWLL